MYSTKMNIITLRANLDVSVKIHKQLLVIVCSKFIEINSD